MFRFMERNTYRMGIRLSKSNLDVDFISSYVLAEYPHFTLIIQSIDNRIFGIIITAEIHNDLHSLIRCDTQLNEAILVFLAAITETYSEYFDLQTEIL